ncbi:MAG: M20 family metallopeptidase [Woeseiaceae bacterium]|jgi:glutamate carboxypeptidase
MSAINAARVFDYVNSQQHVLTGLLRDLVDAESPSSHPETHDEVRRVLRLALASVGFDSREVGQPGEPRHVFARPSERDRNQPLQLVVGHFDTVWPIGTLQECPFRLAGNVIHGPGSFDMKGGLVQLVIALRTIRDLRLEMPVVPMVFVNGDEEIGSRSSTRYIRLLARRAERAYVLEPALGADGKIKTSRKGIGRFTIMVHGKAAHAGLDPEGGASAILELSHVIQKLFALNDAERGITVNVGTIDGGIQPNVIAPHSKAVVDVRVPTVAAGNEIEYIIHSLQPINPDIRLHIEGGIGRPSMEPTPRNQELWEQVREAGEELGLELRQARAGGGSDGNTTSRYTATVDGLGPVGDGAHALHEHLLVDKTLERAALMTLLLTAPSREE